MNRADAYDSSWEGQRDDEAYFAATGIDPRGPDATEAAIKAQRSIYAGRHPICPVVDERNVA